MKPFFQTGDARNKNYSLFRDGREDHHCRGRDYIERIWLECADFVDVDAAERARYDFESVYWELQVAYALKYAGKSVVPRSKLNYRKNEGPDFSLRNRMPGWNVLSYVPERVPTRSRIPSWEKRGVLSRIRSS